MKRAKLLELLLFVFLLALLALCNADAVHEKGVGWDWFCRKFYKPKKKGGGEVIQKKKNDFFISRNKSEIVIPIIPQKQNQDQY